MEGDVWELFKAGIAVDLLVPLGTSTVLDVGVRLRPYKKTLPKNKMILGCGATFPEALEDAIGKAHDGRWESLDWAARPWEVDRPPDLSAYGL